MNRRSWFSALVAPLAGRFFPKAEPDLAELRGMNADLERINAYLWEHIKQDQALIYKMQEALWGFQPPRFHPNCFVLKCEPGKVEWSELQDPTTWT